MLSFPYIDSLQLQVVCVSSTICWYLKPEVSFKTSILVAVWYLRLLRSSFWLSVLWLMLWMYQCWF